MEIVIVPRNQSSSLLMKLRTGPDTIPLCIAVLPPPRPVVPEFGIIRWVVL